MRRSYVAHCYNAMVYSGFQPGFMISQASANGSAVTSGVKPGSGVEALGSCE